MLQRFILDQSLYITTIIDFKSITNTQIVYETGVIRHFVCSISKMEI